MLTSIAVSFPDPIYAAALLRIRGEVCPVVFLSNSAGMSAKVYDKDEQP